MWRLLSEGLAPVAHGAMMVVVAVSVAPVFERADGAPLSIPRPKMRDGLSALLVKVVDKFKAMNDQNDMAMKCRGLRELAWVLLVSVCPVDLVGWIWGEAFLVMVTML